MIKKKRQQRSKRSTQSYEFSRCRLPIFWCYLWFFVVFSGVELKDFVWFINFGSESSLVHVLDYKRQSKSEPSNTAINGLNLLARRIEFFVRRVFYHIHAIDFAQCMVRRSFDFFLWSKTWTEEDMIPLWKRILL